MLTMDDGEQESAIASSTGHQQSGIEVYLRIRASINPSTYCHQDVIDQSQFIFNVPPKRNDGTNSNIVDNSRSRYAFKFNGILDSKSRQDDVFQKLGAPAVRNVLDGYNSTLFAYGQTGSGKTFTITGGPERYSDRGIIPRAISMLFASFLEQSATASFSCYISYLELYNESGYDLLAADDVEVSRLDDMPKVTMLEDEDGNYHFRNLSVNHVNTEEDALNMLFLGDTNRAIGESELNQSSSRSHCIFTIMIEKRLNGSDSVIRSKLNLVDLAGSERVHKTNSTGQSLKEAQYINTSLFFLEMVIVALYEKSKIGKENTHVPYRNSMMTSVLRDSLGGNCKTVMVATISPEAPQIDESISTCQFAQRVALVKNNARINQELEPEVLIRKLKTELQRVREEVKFLKGENGEGDGLTTEDNDELANKIETFIERGEQAELDIGTMTLTKIQAAFSIFKSLFIGNRDHNTEEYSNRSAKGEVDEIKTMRNQIRSLQNTLQQREDEIKSLVQIVKKGGGDMSSYENRAIEAHQNRTEQVQSTSRVYVPSKTRSTIFNAGDLNICGVEKCLDRDILKDPSKAFNWFRLRYPGDKHLNENKSLLQERFQEAKDKGITVKQCKENINAQRLQIEKIRKAAVMEQVLGAKLDDDTHPDELECLSIIEDYKRKYKTGIEHLRELKGTIEHIKKLIEKNQRKMQKDFDTWYAKMYEILESETQTSNSYEKEKKSALSDDNTNEKDVLANHTYDRASVVSQAGISTCIERIPKMKEEFKLPPGIRLTGNKEADDDIIAFYKAKEALMARAKSKSPKMF